MFKSLLLAIGVAAPSCLAAATPWVIIEHDDSLKKQHKVQILEILTAVNQMIAPLEIPQKIPLNLRHTQSKFSLRKDGLWLGYEFRSGTKYADFSRVRYAIAHEWAHAVFDTNMRTRSQDWRKFSDARRRHSPNLRSHLLHAMNKPYNEFFADLVTVLYFEDLAAMTQSLAFTDLNTGKKLNMDPKGIRGFHTDIDLETWTPPRRFDRAAVYTLFAPVRSYVGQTYLSKQTLRERKAEILSACLDAIGSEFKYLHANADALPSPRHLVVRFIQAIDHQMSVRKIAKKRTSF